MCEEVEHDSVMSRGGQEEIRLTAGVKEEKGGEDRRVSRTSDCGNSVSWRGCNLITSRTTECVFN